MSKRKKRRIREVILRSRRILRKSESDRPSLLGQIFVAETLESRLLFSGPAPSFPAAPFFVPGASNFAVTVDYSGSAAINRSTITAGNLSVTGAMIGPLTVTGDTIAPSQNADDLDVTYYVNAPNQIFDQRANDTYTIAVQPNSVFDTQGASATTVSTTMTVNLTPITGPLAAASEPSFMAITASGTASEQLEVTYSDPAGINVSTISSANLSSFTGMLNIRLLSVASQDSGTVVHATYLLTAPRGAFFPADNTGYHVLLDGSTTGNVLDDSGQAFPAGLLALYEVEINPTDPTFPFADSTSSSFVAEASAHQSDGKLIVAGHVGDTTSGLSQIELERFNTDGSLDTTFGNDGLVLGPAGNNEAAFAMAILPNDEILIAGTSARQFALERYTANGTLDTTFGANGTGEVTASIDPNASSEIADAIAIAPDKSIVIAGQSDGSWAFARFTSAGVADGTMLEPLPDGDVGTVGGLAVQSNGMIVAAGADGTAVDVARFETSGQIDPSFNGGAIETLPGLAVRSGLQYIDHNVGLAIDGNGNILVAATTPATTPPTPGDFAVERLTASGAPDTSFGPAHTGLVTTVLGGSADAQQVTFSTGGLIVVTGITVDPIGTHPATETYNSDGSPYVPPSPPVTVPPVTSPVSSTPPLLATISGTVSNGQTGAPQAGVTVDLDAFENGMLAGDQVSATTDPSGEYVFSEVAAGTYSVAEIPPSGFVAEIAEGTVTAASAPIAGPTFANLPAPTGSSAPDLTGSFQSALPATAVGNAAGAVTLRVSNIGDAKATGRIDIALFASPTTTISSGDTPFATIPADLHLRPQQSTDIKLKFNYPSSLPAGSYFILASVDSGNVIAESNEANNVAVSLSRVTIAPPAVSLDGSLIVPSSLKTSQSAAVALLLYNTGNIAATGPVKLTWYASNDQTLDSGDTPLKTTTVHINILPLHHEKLQLRFTVPARAAAGNKYLLASLDASAIPEITQSVLLIPAGSTTAFS